MPIYLGNQQMTENLGGIPIDIIEPIQILTIGSEFQGGYVYSVQGTYPKYTGYIISKEVITIANTCWGCYGIRVPDARNAAIGTGETNTLNIVGSGCGGCGVPVGSAPTAAQASLDYTGSGFTDWWLPTTGDWEQIFANKTLFPFLTSSFEYWTSRENALLNDGLYFGYTAKWSDPSESGSIQSRSKDAGLSFRAARAFAT